LPVCGAPKAIYLGHSGADYRWVPSWRSLMLQAVSEPRQPFHRMRSGEIVSSNRPQK
jgi:hypothetical protein